MGVKLPGILPTKSLNWEDLKGKKIGVDASNVLYQFLSSIRQRDGTPLMDSKGNVTSHISGIFYRSINLMLKGIDLAYIFDGKPPDLKFQTQKARRDRKEKAHSKYLEAKDEEDIDAMGKYAKQVTYLNNEMVQESKDLIKALGMPVIQSPSESDAQGAFMAEKEDIWAFASSDADTLMHGCPRTIPNLTLSEKRRVPGGSFVYIKPELIELKEVLTHLNLNQDQLIVMGILTGTDYNPKGIIGIGPKKALKLVQRENNFEKLFKSLNPDFNWKKIFAIFKSMPIMKNYQLKWESPNIENILKILVDKHEFSQERIEKTLQQLTKKPKDQKGLGSWVK